MKTPKPQHALALVVNPDKMLANVNPTVLLVDCSRSMARSANGQSRYMAARSAVRRIMKDKQPAYVFGFSDSVVKLEAISDIEPRGGTWLAATLREAAKLNPGRLILVTDGEIADSQTCACIIRDEMLTIDGIFIGTDTEAFNALKDLCTGEVFNETPAALGSRVLLLTSGRRE
jgi:hypothetical protein